MTIRRRFATLLIFGAIALGPSTLALAGTAQAKSSCGQSSAQSTYGGQGQQIAAGGPVSPVSVSGGNLTWVVIVAVVALLALDLMFVVLRVPEAREATRGRRELKDAGMELEDSKKFQALMANWKTESASQAAQNDSFDESKQLGTLASRLDTFAPLVGLQTRRLAEQLSSAAKAMIPAAAALTDAQSRFEESGSLDNLKTATSVTDLEHRISLLDHFTTRLKAYQEARTNFIGQLSESLLASATSQGETKAITHLLQDKMMGQRVEELFGLEDAMTELRREMLVFLRDHFGKWQVDSNGNLEFSDDSGDTLRRVMVQASRNRRTLPSFPFSPTAKTIETPPALTLDSATLA